LFFRFQCARILWNKTVAFMDVVIYTKDNCSYCEKIKSVFKLKDINFVEYKLEKDFTREQFINEFGEGSTFPRVSIDGNLIGGASETVNYLRERGIL
jgi:glutaredoxin